MARTLPAAIAVAATLALLPAAAAFAIPYSGGPVLHRPHVYIVFWGFATPAIDDPSGEAPYLKAFFASLGGSAWADILTEYCDGVGCVTNPFNLYTPATDTWYDTTTPVLPDALLASEAAAADSHFSALSGHDPDAVYVIATPHLRNTAGFGIEHCSWHSSTTNAGHLVSYVNRPYNTDAAGLCGPNAGPLDGVSIWAARAYANAVTNPFGNSWRGSSANQEVGSVCPGVHAGGFGGTGFAVPELWSNAASACV
ncbi:MAG: hypothetical protein QOI20_3370 [Acidimicrobiaceae bacterium]|jgi:hypothetical protein|nr:hypothetical protein [Acidimicrobiaceae bacterium]